MRKISLFLGILTSTISVFGYSSTDVSNASFLATEGIIVKQSSTSWYRLDDTITRAEAVGMALKIKKVLLPNNYTCKNYFIDAPYNPNNNWICRAVELAKDNGIVSWENIKARPADPITRSEVLAMTLYAALNNSLSIVPKWYKFSNDTVEWQQNIFYAAEDLISVTGTKYEYSTRPISVNYFPNRNATRAEVFSFARNILVKNGATNNSVYENIFSADFWDDFSQTVDNNITYISFWEKMQALEAPIWTLDHRYSLSIFNNSRFSYAVWDKFERMWTYKWKTYYVFNYSGMCNGRFLIFFAGNKIIKVDSACEEKINVLLDWLEKINFDITSGYRSVNHSDILTIYYQLIDNQNPYWAYSMRSPVWVSEETFVWWYKNVTMVVFREDTLKDFWDNTYEFFVDMTENGVKSTYKVKSKVDLENFKINNISSVKQ